MESMARKSVSQQLHLDESSKQIRWTSLRVGSSLASDLPTKMQAIKSFVFKHLDTGRRGRGMLSLHFEGAAAAKHSG